MLFYVPTSGLSIFLNEAQTKLTLFFLNIFLEPEQLKGIDIWINPQYKIIINQACNGMIPILFLFASILAYPAPLADKIIWMVIGYILFSIINVVRILLVVYATETGEGHKEFFWSHDLVGNTILMMTGLIIFITFITTSRRKVDLK